MGADQSNPGNNFHRLKDASANSKETSRTLQLVLNGKAYQVDPEEEKVTWEWSLVDFIRDKAGLKGTKTMCREGGCGACTVTVKTLNLQTGTPQIRSVNSCLVPLLSCDGWEVETVESLGSCKTSLNPVQNAMVVSSGSQCGFCSPGMIMSMHSLVLMKKNSNFSAKDVEDNLDGNICRCTGYRPILDAFKSLASNSEISAETVIFKNCKGLKDIEDCNADMKCTLNTERNTLVEGVIGIRAFHWTLNADEEWVKPTDLNSLFETINRFSSRGVKYRLVAGNTATGIYKNDGPYKGFIDLSGISELQRVKVQVQQPMPHLNLVELGGGVTIAMAIDALTRSSQFKGFEYTSQISAHFQRVAATSIRNVATLAGNLMIKHAHPEFPSDIFLVLETVGARINIASAPSLQRQYSLLEFLALDMRDKVILTIQLPKLNDTYAFRTFKISHRFQNSHAIVNAGFLLKILSPEHLIVMENPRIVYGGISPTFFHAKETEAFIQGADIADLSVIRKCMSILQKEVPLAGEDDFGKYKQLLAQSLLFKFLVKLLEGRVNSVVASAGIDLERKVTFAMQDFDTEPREWPLYQPISKLESAAQCSGEAEFINDKDPEPGELFGVFVLSTVANADLGEIDASEALAMPGVVAFLTANDIPGLNNYMAFAHQIEPIFASGKVAYAGQAVGLIVAENHLIAKNASKKVKILYSNIQNPILTIREALKTKDGAKMENSNNWNTLVPWIFQEAQFKADDNEGFSTSTKRENERNEKGWKHFNVRDKEPEPKPEPEPIKIISGEFESGSQYHFYMETQTCICVPKEDSFKVYSSTQWMDRLQFALSQCLALPANFFEIEVRRLGGGYGGKISRSAYVACACAVAAYNLNKPVRIVLDLETNMKTIGGRLPYLTQYQVAVNKIGKINKLDVTVTCDCGWSSNEVTSRVSYYAMQSCYQATDWKINCQYVNTNTAPNTFCRAPGTTEAIAGIEVIMDHIAFELKLDPTAVRLANLLQPGDSIYGAPGLKFQSVNLIPSMLDKMEESAGIESRKNLISDFNKRNRWKKKGLSIVPMRYPVHSHLSYFKAHVVIYHVDGTVIISHSGVEMGQGINTKVIQAAAHELRISLFKIRVVPANNVVSSNCTVTGGAITSEYCCFAVMKACKVLLDRMAPIRTKLGVETAWEDVVKESFKAKIDLSVSCQLDYKDAVKSYDIWGLMATEVEIDCLSGEYKISRVDILEDAGKSISPIIDVGQIEGSVIMGFGLWLTEKHSYDSYTGQLLTNSTWNYKPPLPKDIPEDFRVTLLKNADNPLGVLRSKATGEPAVCMSSSVLLALKWAIASARTDSGNNDWFQLDGPVSPQDILHLCLTAAEEFNI